MTSLMVLAICSLLPLSVLAVAVIGLRTGRASVALPLVVSAGVLLMPLLAPAFRAGEQAPSLRFTQQTHTNAAYASLHAAQ
jgi:hypothetical protein